MKFPATMKIVSQVVSVEEVPDLHQEPDDGHEAHPHRAFGVYEAGVQAIWLDKGLTFERQRVTFLHETLHAILDVGSLEALIDRSAGIGLGEHVVTALAPLLLAWLRDNPKAVQYLSEKQ